ncbi:MAG: MFS transporter [Saprospiraceae bacterium]|nr:MFS transporter [Saprospiraceae bacterium]
MKRISRTVWILSLVSFFTDLASEMLYPVMPIYLKEIGFSILLIGILEGIAEAVAGLSKGYFGKLSDQYARRLPFIKSGYSLSAISKPMLALSTIPIWVFFARTIDRIGKGIRTGARDALLSDEATPASKGQIFGLHRAMDTLGAVIGPMVAIWFLGKFPHQYTTLFYLAFIPGVLAVASLFILKEKKRSVQPPTKKIKLLSFLSYWNESPGTYRKLVIGLLAFAVINSSDVFLLLKMKDEGFTDTHVIGIYIFYNLVYAVAAFPLGVAGDRIGLKKVLIGGIFLFGIVYSGMSMAKSQSTFLILFALYGIYAAATEGISKAWISNVVKPSDTATAIGTYTGLQSICALIASSFAGLLWYKLGATSLFLFSGIGALGIILYFFTVPEMPNKK